MKVKKKKSPPKAHHPIHPGIVTAFTMSTYPINHVWGGIKTYSLDHLPALFNAALEYQSNPNKDPYANFMLQAFTTNASVGAVLNMVYLKPEVAPPAFDPFYSIPTTGDTTKLQTLTQMMGGQRVPAIPRYVSPFPSSSPNPTPTLTPHHKKKRKKETKKH